MTNDFQALWKHKFLGFSLIVLLFLPIIYSAVFIYSMWDPYGQTKELPIAVVNEDQGTSVNGTNENIGKEVVKKLKKNDKFDWKFVSQEKADRGIEKGDYFAVITLPKDFSGRASTMLDKHPKEIEMIVAKNPGYSYSGQSIGDKSAQAVKDNVSIAIRELYNKEIFKRIVKSEKAMDDLSKNLKKLSDGESQLQNGSKQVDGGLSQLMQAIPSPQNQAVAQLLAGSQRVTAGIAELQKNTDKISAAIDKNVTELKKQSFKDANAERLSNPVEIKENDVTTVDNYGQSFAPYVLALSLFVGSIAFVSIYPVDKRAGHTESAFKWWFSKALLIMTHGLLQGLLLAFFTMNIIQIKIADPGHFVLTVVTWSLTAIFIVSFLTGVFGNIGKFLSIIILILQLGSSEGTFPIQLTNPFFQSLHMYSPMTYVIKALRESIFGFEGNIPFEQAITIIVVIGLVMMALLYLGYLVKLRLPQLRLNTRDLD